MQKLIKLVSLSPHTFTLNEKYDIDGRVGLRLACCLPDKLVSGMYSVVQRYGNTFSGTKNHAKGLKYPKTLVEGWNHDRTAFDDHIISHKLTKQVGTRRDR